MWAKSPPFPLNFGPGATVFSVHVLPYLRMYAFYKYYCCTVIRQLFHWKHWKLATDVIHLLGLVWHPSGFTIEALCTDRRVFLKVDRLRLIFVINREHTSLPSRLEYVLMLCQLASSKAESEHFIWVFTAQNLRLCTVSVLDMRNPAKKPIKKQIKQFVTSRLIC